MNILNRSSKRLLSSSSSSIRRRSSSSSSSSSTSTSTSSISTIVSKLQSILGSNNKILSKNDDEFKNYTTDWTQKYEGGGIVVFPRNSNDVSNIVKLCNDNNIAIVPQGGNTGLVGGSIGSNDNELIISLSKMNKIIEFDEVSGTVTCEAGVILESLNIYASDRNFLVPFDLGAKGSCMIGGNIATNAGGLRVLKYGSIHNCLLGLEVVLANGEVLDMTRTLQKDNTGYHLKNMFVGSEGTLGIITKIVLKLVTKPTSSNVIVIKVPSFDHVPKLLKEAKVKLNDILSAFEFMDASCINAVKKVYPNLLQGLSPTMYPIDNDDMTTTTGISGEILVLIETSGFCKDSDTTRLYEFIEQNMIIDSSSSSSNNDKRFIIDATIAQDVKQEKALWSIRENVPVALMTLSRNLYGKLFKYDVSLSLIEHNSFISKISKELINKGYCIGSNNSSSNNSGSSSSSNGKRTLEIYNFGHAGDQNLHLNIMYSSNNNISNSIINEIQKDLDEVIYTNIISIKGSISAEHGIGLLKKKVLPLTKSTTEMNLMKQIKQTLDPKNIMNPGKIF